MYFVFVFFFSENTPASYDGALLEYLNEEILVETP